MSPASPSPEPTSRPTVHARRAAAKKTLRNRLIAGALAIGGLFVAEKQ